MPTRLAALALRYTNKAIAPLLAMDAKVPLLPIFEKVDSKNFDAKALAAKVREACKGKTLAADEDMPHVEKMLGGIGEAAKQDQKGADESVSQPQHNAMMAAAEGKSNLGISPEVGKEFKDADKGNGFDEAAFGEYMKGKGHGDNVVKDAAEFMLHHGVEHPEAKDAESEEAKKKAEEEKMAAARKEGEDSAKKAMDAALKSMVTVDSMNDAIKASVKAERDRSAGVAEALGKVRAYVGEISNLTFDSGEAVYRHALEMMGVPEAKTIHASALETILSLRPKAGARPNDVPRPTIAADSATKSSFDEMFKDANRIEAM